MAIIFQTLKTVKKDPFSKTKHKHIIVKCEGTYHNGEGLGNF